MDPEDMEVQGNHQECKNKIGNTNGSSQALQDL